jgi:hypothetical protein
MTIELKNRKQYETLNEKHVVVKDATSLDWIRRERFHVFMSLTRGELMALQHALTMYAEASPVGNDVHGYLEWALTEEKIDL